MQTSSSGYRLLRSRNRRSAWKLRFFGVSACVIFRKSLGLASDSPQLHPYGRPDGGEFVRHLVPAGRSTQPRWRGGQHCRWRRRRDLHAGAQLVHPDRIRKPGCGASLGERSRTGAAAQPRGILRVILMPWPSVDRTFSLGHRRSLACKSASGASPGWPNSNVGAGGPLVSVRKLGTERCAMLGAGSIISSERHSAHGFWSVRQALCSTLVPLSGGLQWAAGSSAHPRVGIGGRMLCMPWGEASRGKGHLHSVAPCHGVSAWGLPRRKATPGTLRSPPCAVRCVGGSVAQAPPGKRAETYSARGPIP